MGKKNSTKSSSVFPDIDGERIALPPNVEELTYTSSVPGDNDLLFRYRGVEVRVGQTILPKEKAPISARRTRDPPPKIVEQNKLSILPTHPRCWMISEVNYSFFFFHHLIKY